MGAVAAPYELGGRGGFVRGKGASAEVKKGQIHTTSLPCALTGCTLITRLFL